MKTSTLVVASLLALLPLSFALPLSRNLDPYFNPEENIGVTGVFLMDGDIQVDLRRNAVRDIYLTWLNRTVPYVIDKSYNAMQRNEILLAMREFERQSCLHFRPRTSELDYIRIAPEGGCSSAVGRRGGAQVVSIGQGCDMKGTIMHELMHAIGFWHEHSRPDRDDYIQIVWNNIPEQHLNNFRKYSEADVDSLGAPYDYDSITHYKNNTFAKDRNLATIKAKFPLPPGVEMGQRMKLSEIDLVKINRLYRCNISHCPDAGVQKNGFRQGNNFRVSQSVAYNCSHGYLLVGSRARFCMDLGKWTGNFPTCIETYRGGPLHYCNFDERTLCGWKQDYTDDLNWTIHNRNTPSDGTGPQEDRTMATPEGYYIYLESSNPSQMDHKARIISPTFSFHGTKACLVFFYNMYGSTMGTLNVYQRVGGKNLLEFRQEQDQGRQWHIAAIVLDDYSSFQIVIEAVAGSSYKSDMAVDDILVGSCDSLADMANAGDVPESTSCDFDTNMCGWSQANDDGFDWQLMTGSTSTFNTGPDCDPKNCANGRYLYTEASAPRRPGDLARILSPTLRGGGARCLSFSYHMFGETMGTLRVYLAELGSPYKLLWSRSGDHGPVWHREHIDIFPSGLFQVVLEGERGSSYRSDTAVDKIEIVKSTCEDILRFDCDFEQDTCGWQNLQRTGDQFDWTRHSGPTGTMNTGPSGDHTARTGYYMYIETSHRFPGDVAQLLSPLITDQAVGFCMVFWYHMYGAHVATLSVLRRTGDTFHKDTVLLQLHGDKGDIWRRQMVYLTSISQDFRVLIEGMAGGYKSDIAIDDITLHPGTCFGYDSSHDAAGAGSPSAQQRRGSLGGRMSRPLGGSRAIQQG